MAFSESPPQKSAQTVLPVFIVLALLFFAGAAVAIPMYKEELSTVAQSKIPDEGKDGELRALVTFRPEGANPLPPCLAYFKSGKNYNYRNFHGDNVVVFANGRSLPVKERQTVEFFQNEQPFRPRKSDAYTAKADEYFRRENSSVSSYSFLHCLSDSEKVWIEGCVKNGQIVGCGGPRSEVTITPGGPEIRRRYIFIHAIGGLALILLGAGAIFLGLIEHHRYSGRLLDELARRQTGRMPRDTTTSIAGLCGIVCMFSLFAWPSTPGPLITLLGTIAAIVVMFVEAIGRIRVLRAGRGYLDSKVTAPLHSPPQNNQEWVVEVPPNAATYDGFYLGSRHALVQFEITEHYVLDSGGKRLKTRRPVAKYNFPQALAIVDASGPGILDTSHCLIEGQKMPEIELSDSARPAWFTEIMKAIPRAPLHEKYVIQWSVIELGDRLLIHGDAGRIRSETLGVSMPGGYRAIPEVPQIRGNAGTSAIVCVGDKSKLRSGIGAELRAHVVGLIVVVLALGTSMVIGAWIARQFT
jgi:hypothetical protein